jgi:hypothetical protein
MKIRVKLPKPRNPLAVLVKQRKGGAHGASQPARAERRKYKQRLHGVVSGHPVGTTPTDCGADVEFIFSDSNGALRAECTNKPIRLTVANAAPV